MRTLLFILLLAAWSPHTYAQVARVEYFFDADPGAGKGMPLSVATGNQTGGNFQLPMSTLSNGFHTLFIRAANSAGLWSHTTSAQFFLQETSVPQINRTEYFLDTDPGEGKGTSVNVSSAPAGSTFFIPLNTVPGGMHTLFIRTRDDNGRWSHVNSQAFYVQPHSGSTVPAIEYFIDNDPGMGKATAVTIPANGSLNAIIPLSNTPVGFHTLGIRAKDDQGRWGQTQAYAFFVNERNDAQIDRIEYYFQNTEDTSSTYTYKVPEPSASVSLDFDADLSGLQGEKEYTMFLYAVTNTGVKSLVHSKQVKVCGGAVAAAKFGNIAMGTEISFIDSSRDATKYYWDFGDGSIDSVSNPVHKYAEGGNYTVKLVVENFCNRDTVEQIVNALTLQSIYPNRGGNTGSVTVSILGGGFANPGSITITNGSAQYQGKDVSIRKGGNELVTTFELINAPQGSYDLTVEQQGSSYTLANAITIEPLATPDFNITIAGRNSARVGIKQKYSIDVTNKGNVDAHGVPIWIAVPHGSTIDFDFTVYTLKSSPIHKDSISTYFTTDSLFSSRYDSMDIYPLLIPLIPAESSIKYDFDLTQKSVKETQLKAFVFSPIYGSPPNPQYIDCNSTIVNKSLYETFTDQIKCKQKVDQFFRTNQEKLTKHPCAGISYDALERAYGKIGDCDIHKWYYGQAFSLPHIVLQSIAEQGPGIILACGSDGRNIVDLMKSKNAKEAIYKLLKRIFMNKMKAAAESKLACSGIFGFKALESLRVQVVASFDPNEKTGPSGNTAQHYTQGSAPFNYTIYFENVDTATAPAQEVIIVDTLDKSKFDLSTFQVTAYGFADSTYKAPPGLNAYAGQTVFRRSAKPDLHVRFDAKLDTAAGVVTWRFLSIDPLTRELTDDPLDGFLAPNKNKAEGEGFVSFSIALKPGFNTGTAIRNKALIYFDNNKPIVTNEYLNTIDVTAPQSRVNTLPAQTPDTSFTVKWSGSDAHAGVRGYDVYVAINNGPFTLWHYDIAATEAVFTGQKDSTYRFYSIAKDYAGNTEAGKTGAEATVKIVPNAITPVDDINNPGLVFQVRPNPVAANAFVFLKLPQAEDVTITLLDVHGRMVELVTKGMRSAGEHHLPLQHDALQRGIYLLKLQSKTYQKTIRMMK
ncbi:PKD domain-containing protein [Parasegetibacter sp. NRK P23]|uniref:DUF7619 domain-containing protein n=1 Tax=Parasegetibacter sp. NRK P23 TaxID=2942999 RepID=UPI00204449D7|nr:PKD domain-containing protein [Parasegetibacter sp. NRK P23]MCM5529433.1 PKD domain-containing protein [Parasegetibacter sp. NRK P23]